MNYFVLDCSTESDVLFLLDSSRSVSFDNIKLQVEFIISLASTLSLKSIGVMSYATEAQFHTTPGQFSSVSEFAEALHAATFSRGHKKNLGNALMKTIEEPELFNSSRPLVVVAMIAGKAEDEYAVLASKIQNRGATIIGMALGTSYNYPQLNLLATKPSTDHILYADFHELKQFVSTTRSKICEGTYTNFTQDNNTLNNLVSLSLI